MEKNEIFIILRATCDDAIDAKYLKDIKFTKIWKKNDNKIAGNNILKYKNFGFSIEKKYHNQEYIQEILDIFFLDESSIKVAKLNFLKKELMIVIYSYNKFPAIIYNSKFLKFLGDNNIELSHDIYTFERKI